MRPRTVALLAAALLLAPPATASAQDGGTQTVQPVPHQQVPTTSTPAAPAQSQPAPQPTPDPAAAPNAADQRVEQATRDPRDDGAPPAVVALAVLAILAVTLLALWGVLRWAAWEPDWAPRWRHAAAEAGWRASLGWADFRDWLRLGR